MTGSPMARRLAYLDGLRGLAILAVVGFHYFSCFPTFYPYGRAWAELPWFRWGHLGVHLFFGISGFVIAMTLERCHGLTDFALRRFARLWPTLALCAVISYLVLSVLPSPWTPRPADFLPSLTFVDGAVWAKLWPGLDANWIDVAYWSLFVEVRFYALAALLWWLSPRRFAPGLFAFSSVVVVLYAWLHAAGWPARAEWLQWAFAAKFLPWFVLGVAAREAMQGRAARTAVGVAAAAAQTAVLSAMGDPHAHPVALLVVTLLLLGPQRWPWLERVLSTPALVAVGIASYSLYLLHQYAGLALIATISRSLGLQGPAAVPVALLVALACIAVARTLHRRWEVPMNDAIVRWGSRWRVETVIPGVHGHRADATP